MNNPRMTPKERAMVAASIRRVFSRSELRARVMAICKVDHADSERPRVKRWSLCPKCNQFTPSYQMQCDHIEPVIHVNERLEDITWNDLVNRIWCENKNLQPLCLTCHKAKSKIENKRRRELKKEKANGT